MTDQALNAAIARLERAVERIERSAATSGDHRDIAVEAYAQLELRHDRLRARIQETIGRLDALIGETGSAG